MAIFLSHSQHDRELVDLMRRGLGVLGSNLQAVVYEDLVPANRGQDSQRIKELIEQSSAVFLFQTPNTEKSPFTRTWIQFEVGVAATLTKPLVVCQQKDYAPSMPLAYLTDFVTFDEKHPHDLVKVQEIARAHGAAGPVQRRLVHAGAGTIAGSVFGPWGAGIGFLGGLLFPWKHSLAKVMGLRCQCGYTYRYWGSPGSTFNCPACLEKRTCEVKRDPQRLGS